MNKCIFACVILCLSLGHSSAFAFVPTSQTAPCDDFLPGDFDIDGDIDQNDFDFFESCQTRAAVPSSDPHCKDADFDRDDDVDMDDFAILQRMITGSQSCGPNLKEPPTAPPAEPTQISMVDYRTLDVKGINSVYGFSGEFYQQVEDLRIKGRGLDFVWTRKYRSRIGLDTAMGKGWDFSYNLQVERIGPSIRLYDGNNRTDVYTSIFTAANYMRFGIARDLVKNPDSTYTLNFADTSTWSFNPFDGSSAPGKISKIQDHNGNLLTFSYDGLGRLITIHDTLDTVSHDRDITISYNADGYIAAVTDYTGRSVTYTYYQSGDAGGSAGDLKSVTTPAVVGTPNGNDFPTGKTTLYTYSKDFADERLNHNLLTITDPKGQIYLTNIYGTDVDTAQTLQFDRVIQQVWGDAGDRINVVYKTQVPSSANNNAVVKATINDRVGNVSEYSYDRHNRLVIQREYTGRADPDLATDLEQNINPPVNPLRSSDPAFFQTVTTYNQEGDESKYSYPRRIDYPNGNAIEFTYELALNPNAPKRSCLNLRQIRRLPGPLGGTQSEIIEQYEYDPNNNFLTRHVDPRTHETLHTYDTNGNRIHTQHAISSIVEDWEYNTHGQMTAHTLPDNGSNHRRRDEYTYYSSGPQQGYLNQEIVDAPGLALTTTYQYDALGRIVGTINPQGNDTVYTLNSLGRVVRRTSPEATAGGGVHYQHDVFYDANDNIIRVELSDTSGLVSPLITTYAYDILNSTTGITVEQALTQMTVLQYAYDANRNRTLTRYGEAINGTQPANTLTVQYDERGKKYREIRGSGSPEQSTTQYNYDQNGNVLSVETVEIAHGGMAFTYDGYNRRITSTDAMGNVHTYTYNPSNGLDADRLDGQELDVAGSTGNVRLRELTYTYDAMDRRITQSDAFFNIHTQAAIGDGQVTTQFTYADTGQLVRLENDNTNAWQITYDTANRRSLVTDPKANTTAYSYDTNGNVVAITEVDKSDLGNPNQTIITAYAYDNLDRRIRRVDNASNITTYEYDARGNLVRQIDPRNTETIFTYDMLDRQLQSIVDMNSTGASASDPADITNSQTWDASSRLIASTDDNSNTTQYTYDALGRIITVHNADNTSSTMTYDANDKVIAMTDANGTNITYSYDLMNRRIGKTITPASGVIGTTSESYTFDGASRLVSATDDDSAITRQYDSLSHILLETQRVVPAGPAVTITAEYDGLGNRTHVVYPGGRNLAYTFDSLNRALQISDNPPVVGSTLATYSYLGPQCVERRDLGNGTRLEVGYDNLRRAINTHHTRISPSANIDNRSYGFDPNDNKMQMQSAGAVPADVRFYQYDAADRMFQSQNPPTATSVLYALDGVGNRMNVSGGTDAGTYARNPVLPEPADYQVNQYTSVTTSPNPPQNRTYDRNGNQKTSNNGQRLYSYDYRNQLVEFTDMAAGVTIIYKYDCLGRRIEQNASGTLTRFYYEGTRNIEEQNQSNITLATYVYNFGLLCEGDNDGDPITMTRGGQKYFYHCDDIGSTVRLTNASGQIVEQYQYDDFGKPLFYNSLGSPITASAFGNPYLFAGNRYDIGSGFMYRCGNTCGNISRTTIDSGNNLNWNFSGNAYVDPNIGRTITRLKPDSLGNGLTYNGNNPASNNGSGERDYCVQYRESDFNFVSRLMEEEGIYYYFNHSSTLKPSVLGSQTAVVVGPPNESISTDKYGRVKVQFHWDREGKKDDNTNIRTISPSITSNSGNIDVNPTLYQPTVSGEPLIIHAIPGLALTPSVVVVSGSNPDPNLCPPDDANSPSNPYDGLSGVDYELVSGTTPIVRGGGGCGVTGFEAVPFMLLWLWAAKRNKKSAALARP